MTPCHTPTTLRMATICSGIGAPEVASIGLPYEHVFMAEIEAFPSAVLAHHWPHVPNLGDMTKIDGESYRGKVDVLVGGTPCQAFSVAGKRESLNDERGNLTLKFVELCDAINPAFVLWENVPGVLSTADNAFGCFLGALSGNDGELFPAGDGWSNAGCVIGPKRKLAWRILDAQYFGLAQRRRRVFVVACPRDGADHCEILFEREGVQRHSAPSREAGKGPAGTLEGRSRAGGFPGTDGACSGHVVPTCFGGNNTSGPIDVATARNASGSASGRMDFESETFAVAFGGDIARTLQARHDSSPCADRGMDVVEFAQNQLGEVRMGAVANTLNTNFNASGRNAPCVAVGTDCFNGEVTGDVAATMGTRWSSQNSSGPTVAVAIGLDEEQNAMLDGFGTLKARQQGGGFEGSVMTPTMQVRRLTPVECERLQGFPDSYTAIPWRNKSAIDCPDGPRYKALGNSMAVPVIRWILRRIADAE